MKWQKCKKPKFAPLLQVCFSPRASWYIGVKLVGMGEMHQTLPASLSLCKQPNQEEQKQLSNSHLPLPFTGKGLCHPGQASTRYRREGRVHVICSLPVLTYWLSKCTTYLSLLKFLYVKRPQTGQLLLELFGVIAKFSLQTFFNKQRSLIP